MYKNMCFKETFKVKSLKFVKKKFNNKINPGKSNAKT